MTSQITLVRWLRTQLGWYKLNVDGLEKNIMIGAEGIIGMDKGIWVISFMKFIGYRNIELAQAWSLYLGLKIANNLKTKNLEIETDCHQILNLILEKR